MVDDGGAEALRESETERGPNVINTETYLNNCVEIFGRSVLKKPGTICLKRNSCSLDLSRHSSRLMRNIIFNQMPRSGASRLLNHDAQHNVGDPEAPTILNIHQNVTKSECSFFLTLNPYVRIGWMVWMLLLAWRCG